MYTFINVFLITLKHIAHYYYNGFEEDIHFYIHWNLEFLLLQLIFLQLKNGSELGIIHET